jgi:glucose/arabinose dehydrogenase
MTTLLRLSLAALPALVSTAVAAAPPTISRCDVFPAKNYWNTPVDTLQVHSQSTTWVNTIGAATATHPDFGTFFEGNSIGIPWVTVPGTQTPVTINFDESDESDPGPYPIPPDAPIEGFPDSDGDRHVLVVDRDNCVLYELYSSFKNPDNSWDAFSGAKWDFKLNANRPDTFTSADAAGLPILPGLVRRDEYMAGEINHAIRFTAANAHTKKQHIWPATHDASPNTGASLVPFGARFRLKASFNISGYAPQTQAVMRALKKYGMVMADNGSDWFMSGEHNAAWDDELLDELKTMHGSDFEAVDTAPLRIADNSTQAFQPPPALTFREVASGLDQPLDIQHANDGSGRLFIVEKTGSIKILKNGAILPTPFFTRAVDTASERGLLGLAFDPNFTANRRFFVFYVPNDGTGNLQVSRYLASAGNPDLADMASESPIITIAHPGQSNHNGGKIAFGPLDGYLYVSVGDGGSADDPPNNAQNQNALLGKLLRLDVSAGGPGYAIPGTNPFVNIAGKRGEIWAFGLRNPFRFSFDRMLGDLFIGDVGQGAMEEIDYQPAGVAGGRNYGWKVFEGTACRPPTTGCSLADHTPPILAYGRSVGTTVTGGHVYRGRKSRALRGYYIYADYGSNRFWALTREGSAWGNFELVKTVTPASPGVNGPAAFGEDETGELYFASLNNGRVFAIDGPAPRVTERVMDMNGNGKDDMLWQHSDGRVAVWLMNGKAGSGVSAEILGPGTGWTPIQVADFDGDTKTDILWQHTDGRAAIWMMNGAAPASTAQIINAGSGWSVVGVGDFNADGKADLVWQHTDGRAAIWLMNGGVMSSGAEILAAGGGWSVNKVADFDGDGKADILWANGDGRAAIWLMNGLAVKSGAQIMNAGTGWSAIHAADLNGDGRADIVWRHTNGTIAGWLMSGTTMTAGGGILGAGTAWNVVRTADFDGDGKADLLFQQPDGRTAIYLMDGLTPTSTAELPGLTGWLVKRVGDFNGNGLSDVVMQRISDGTVMVMLVHGTTTDSAGPFLLGGGTGWNVSTAGQ